MIGEIKAKISESEARNLEKDLAEHIEAEWRLAATIIDRLMLIIAAVVAIVIPIVFLLLRPDYNNIELK